MTEKSRWLSGPSSTKSTRPQSESRRDGDGLCAGRFVVSDLDGRSIVAVLVNGPVGNVTLNVLPSPNRL